MVGGGNRRDEGSFTVSNTNVFAALESLRKKKKSDKEKGSSKGSSRAASGKSKEAEEEKPQLYWSPTPLTVKSWADVDDEDDDDYYATTAPLQAIWAGSGMNKTEVSKQPDPVEESESEDELLDEGDDDVEEEHEHEPEVHEQPELNVKNPIELSPAPKETERQLSKKERKKKELAELEAILADFGLNPKEKAEDEPSDATKQKKEGELNGDTEKKDNNAPAESKSAKKKKKKDKAPKEVKEPQEPLNSSDAPNGQGETAAAVEVEEDASAVDVKERLKKVASSKKKKSNKDMDTAARAASAEASARSAKLAAAKKKEKNHYNQQPTR